MKDIKRILELNVCQKWHEFYIEVVFKVFKILLSNLVELIKTDTYMFYVIQDQLVFLDSWSTFTIRTTGHTRLFLSTKV